MAAAAPRKKDQLYSICASSAPGGTFSQDDLMKTKVAETLKELMELCQVLVNEQLFELLETDGRLCWRVRGKEEAAK